jgi:hypothetical protein
MIKAWERIHLLCNGCDQRIVGNIMVLRQVEGKFFGYLQNLTKFQVTKNSFTLWYKVIQQIMCE